MHDEDEAVDFRPVGAGYMVVLRHPHGDDERRPLLGWTRRGHRWLPTYWLHGELFALDLQSPALAEDPIPEHAAIEVLLPSGRSVDLAMHNGHAADPPPERIRQVSPHLPIHG